MTESPRPSPPPVPASIAEHSRPAIAAQPDSPPTATQALTIHHNIVIPDLTIKDWTWRMFKAGLALCLVSIALLFPFVLIKIIEKFVTSSNFSL